jgi:hypothetical protein
MIVRSDMNFASDAKIINLPLPTSAGDGANKEYVDAKSQGLVPKTACRAATTVAGGNITLSTAPAAIDVVTLAQDDRVLVKNQTDPIENGIYVYNGVGNAMTRATDMAATSHAQGVYVFITEGTVNTGTSWVCTTEAPGDVVGTDELTFSLFSAVTPYTFRDGLKRTGNYVDVEPGLGLSIAGGAGTSGALDIHLDTTINSGNGGGLQIDAGGAGQGLSAKVDGTKVVLNASGEISLGSTFGLAKFADDVGDGIHKDITVTHNLNTTDVQVEVRAAAAPKTVILVDWKVTGVNAIELNFKSKPSSAQYRCVVIG